MEGKTIINIGTNKGNIQGAEFNKPFGDITSSEVQEVADLHYDDCEVMGWCVRGSELMEEYKYE